jgi:hypothetical protein
MDLKTSISYSKISVVFPYTTCRQVENRSCPPALQFSQGMNNLTLMLPCRSISGPSLFLLHRVLLCAIFLHHWVFSRASV